MNKGLLYRYRHWRRYQEILNVLVKHGFSFLIEKLELPGLPFHRRLQGGIKLQRKEESTQLPRQVVQVLEELGPAFIKLGQLLSTRVDLLPEPFLKELQLLQDRVPPIPYSEVEMVFKKENGVGIETVFSSFDEEPLASASIGQVHRAVFKDGREVVVKVQRPDIERIIRTDFEIMLELANLIEKRTRVGQVYRITEMLDELSTYVFEELDFTLEGRNAEIFRKNFADDPYVYIPKVYWDYTTPRILVMEYVKGHKITTREDMEEAGIDPVFVARKLTDAMIRQIYVFGIFHSDPHPGNLAVLPGNKIVFMDFGQVGQLSEELREEAADLVLAMVRHDVDAIVSCLLSIGVVSDKVNFRKLKHDLSRLERKYYGLPLSKIEIGRSIQELMGILYHYQIRVPSDFTMALKALVTLEGVIREIAPEMSLAEIAESFARKAYYQRFAPRRWQKRLWREIAETVGSICRIPRFAEDVVNKLNRGEVSLVVEHKELISILDKLHKAMNRLALSIIFASILIVSAFLVRSVLSPVFFNLHIPELLFAFTLVFSFVLVLACFFANRS
ncbi:MAG: ABC-1-like protein kinase [Thermoanaerobacterales bacterium 50_218]|nr:MAG: ABC-1-like protein kinase [Thermoanaerobacterales bacterium 50_218]HAA90304.1 ABC transporter [Peptococcaceae bacterium]